MSTKRRSFTNQKKFKIVLEAIKGEHQITEIAKEYEVHPNQITKWKKTFLENGHSVFSTKKDTRAEELEETQEDLYKKIGYQQVQIDWLKKNIKKYGL